MPGRERVTVAVPMSFSGTRVATAFPALSVVMVVVVGVVEPTWNAPRSVVMVNAIPARVTSVEPDLSWAVTAELLELPLMSEVGLATRVALTWATVMPSATGVGSDLVAVT